MKRSNKNTQEKREELNGIKLCLLQLGQETESCGLHFSALMIRAAAKSLDDPPYSPESVSR